MQRKSSFLIMLPLTILKFWFLFDTRTAATRYISRGNERCVKFFVQDVEKKYYQGAANDLIDDKSSWGFTSLGDVLDPSTENYDTRWPKIDLWFLNQFRISSLRVYDYNLADFIVIDASLAVLDIKTHNEFIENVSNFLPAFYRKPHLLVLNHAVFPYIALKSRLFDHNNTRNLTYISMVNNNLSNVVTCPYFTHVHWSQGSWRFQNSKGTELFEKHKSLATQPPMRREKGTMPNTPNDGFFFGKKLEESRELQAHMSDLIATKSQFSVGIFNIRRQDRYQIWKSCISRPNLCNYFNYTEGESVIPVYKEMKKSLYVFHPIGDNMARSAWYDTLLADSIPVVFDVNYRQYLAFNNRINLDELMEIIPVLNKGSREDRSNISDDPNLVDMLYQRFHMMTVLKKTQRIRKFQHIFQYMVNPIHERITFQSISTISPLDDAFTTTIKEAVA